MKSTLRDVAESRFAALTRREETAMSEVEADLLATQNKTARLKALRLANEAEKLAANVSGLAKRRLATAS